MTVPVSPDLSSLLGPLIRDVPDFPKPGVVFKDIGPLLRDPAAFSTVVDAFATATRAALVGGDDGGDATPSRDASGGGAGDVPGGAVGFDPGFDVVLGIEARGFLFGVPVALRTGTGFVPVRKAGKLPGATLSASYALEYGEATIEVQDGAVHPGDRVLVVDDVLATGGTVAASLELVARAGGTVVAVAVLLELGFLGGAAALRGRGYTGPLVALRTV